WGLILKLFLIHSRRVKNCHVLRLFHPSDRQPIQSEIFPMTPRRQKVDSDADRVQRVQDRFFPTERPIIPNLDYYNDLHPAQGTNKDYIDYFEMNDRNLGLTVGDVGGKGTPNALLTSSLHTMIRDLRSARIFSL